MKLLKGKAVLLIAGLVLGAGGVLAAVMVVGLPIGPAKAAPAPKAPEPALGIIYPTRERIVNLADSGVLRYLKANISLEILDPGLKGELPKGDDYKKKQDDLAKDLKGQVPVIDDQITSILSAKTSTELMTVDGKQRLKDELKSKLNRTLGEDRILAVYFTDFIIQ